MKKRRSRHDGVDPEAWLRSTIACIAGHPASRIDKLLP